MRACVQLRFSVVGSDHLIQTRRRAAPAGALSPLQTLSAPGQDAAEPQTAALNGGDTVFVWRRGEAGARRIQMRLRDGPTGVLSAVLDITGSGGDAFLPQLASNGTTVTIGWLGTESGVTRARYRGYDVQTGTLAQAQNLSDTSASATTLAVAETAGGLFAWVRGGRAQSNVFHAELIFGA